MNLVFESEWASLRVILSGNVGKTRYISLGVTGSIFCLLRWWAWLLPFYRKPATVKQAPIEQGYVNSTSDHLDLFLVAASPACSNMAYALHASF
ncbi:MAG: hypothetical protein H6569_15430 [Lewinellaceae bacterium]|nr:hypothetical protein [Lewinellaceae bacterium]